MVSTASDNLRESPFKLYDLKLLYDGSLYSDVIIKAVLRDLPEVKKHINFNEPLGEDTINLSGLLGNNNGFFEWGSAGFEKSARNIQLRVENKKRYIYADLQDRTGAWVENCSQLLDDHIDFVEYLTAESENQGKKWYRLGFKNVPPPKRTLVLCFDGTSNHFSNQNTNVVKLMELLRKDDPERQMVYYQTGVGTYAPQGQSSSLGLYIGKKLDEKVAWYLYQHVIDGYKYLVETYKAGDRICIFGFSRGAFTARALAGMVHCVGLLPRHNIEHIPFAYEIYKSADDSAESKDSQKNPTGSNVGPGAISSELECEGALSSQPGNSNAKKINPMDFKQAFCIPVKVHFVGVWDTVASVGSIWPKDLPWIDYNPSIIHFRQALALDERRANFVPSLWNHYRTDIESQTVREVWFRGTHADIGGGSALTESQEEDRKKGGKDYRRISNVALRWMVRQCLDKEIESGIMFDMKALERYRKVGVLEPRPPQEKGESWAAYQTRLLSHSDELDKEDMKLKEVNSLGWSIGWNILEFLPLRRRVQTPTGHSYTHVPNCRRPRSIYRYKSDHPIAIHASAVNHMALGQSDSKAYAPQAVLHDCGAKSDPAIEDGPNLNWTSTSLSSLSFPQTGGWWEWLRSWWKAPAVQDRVTEEVAPVPTVSPSESAEGLIRR